MFAARAPAAPSDKLNLGQSFGELNEDGETLVGAGVDHADFELVNVVALDGHASGAGIKIRKRAVD